MTPTEECQIGPLNLAPKLNKRNSVAVAIVIGLLIVALPPVCLAAELPNAPSAMVQTSAFTSSSFTSQEPGVPQNEKRNLIDKRFLSLALVSTGSTFADSYTTLFARQNWLARKPGVCNVEVQSAYLYGTHPTVARSYAVASGKSAGALFAAYYLRKHHNRFWSFPLVANSVVSLEGVTQNMIACN
jgi:hypothetical protein